VVDPLFWLGLSILLVAASLTAVLVAALPAFRELARAARSAEKLFDTLSRELPPTLEAIRLTSLEITDLKDDVSDGVQKAGNVVQQIDQSISGVKQQAQQAQRTTRGVIAGVKAAWKSWNRPLPKRPSDSQTPRQSIDPTPVLESGATPLGLPAQAKSPLGLNPPDSSASEPSPLQNESASSDQTSSEQRWDRPLEQPLSQEGDRRSTSAPSDPEADDAPQELPLRLTPTDIFKQEG
jgi:uncharacterized protein YoxC